MKIAVIGAAGKAGSLIAKEALDRGHEVTAVVKPGSEDRVPKGCAVLAKSLFDLTSADLKGFYAVVNAFGTPYDVPGKEKEHIDAAKLLIAIGRELPQVRFLTIGGYGSLYMDETRTKQVVDDIPKDVGRCPGPPRRPWIYSGLPISTGLFSALRAISIPRGRGPGATPWGVTWSS